MRIGIGFPLSAILFFMIVAPALAQPTTGAESIGQASAPWIGHGITGLIGLGLLIGIAAWGAMLTGRIERPGGLNAFKPHRWAGILFALFMAGTFVWGLWVTRQIDKPLMTSIHGWLGLVIVLGAAIQVVPGMLAGKRSRLRLSHRWLGYGLGLLVFIQVGWGLHVAVVGRIRTLVLLHSLSGAVAALALVWLLFELAYPKEKGIRRSKIAGMVAAAFNIAGCWGVGGYGYLTEYRRYIRPRIIERRPWAHLILTEAKEHDFLFLPVLSVLLVLGLFTLGRALLTDRRSRRGMAALAAFTLLLVLMMFVMGAIISDAGN